MPRSSTTVSQRTSNAPRAGYLALKALNRLQNPCSSRRALNMNSTTSPVVGRVVDAIVNNGDDDDDGSDDSEGGQKVMTNG